MRYNKIHNAILEQLEEIFCLKNNALDVFVADTKTKQQDILKIRSGYLMFYTGLLFGFKVHFQNFIYLGGKK